MKAVRGGHITGEQLPSINWLVSNCSNEVFSEKIIGKEHPKIENLETLGKTVLFAMEFLYVVKNFKSGWETALFERQFYILFFWSLFI